MERIYNMRVHVQGDSEYTRCEIHTSGYLHDTAKAITLSNIMKALDLNPDSISDLAIVSVAFEHCQDEKISG